MSREFGQFLNELEAKHPQHLVTLDEEIDPLSFEISAIMRHLTASSRLPVLLLNNVRTVNRARSHFPLADNLYASRELVALALGLPPQETGMGLSLEFSRREAQKIEPMVVGRAEAPVKEVIKTGEEIDLGDLPMGRFHEMDSGPFLTMVDVMKGDGGFYDVSFCKHMLLDSRKLTVSLHHTIRKHLLYILERNELKNAPTRVAIVLGHHPAFYLGAGALNEFGNNDYETIGAFMGEPLRLTASETWGEDFLVPADAEIVVEGETVPGAREVQNPFGEYSGYYQPQCLMPLMVATAMTHRKGAVMQEVFPGRESHFNIGGIPKEGSIYREIKRVLPGVVAVSLPHSGSSRMSCYVSIRKTREGDAKLAGVVPFTIAGQLKYVVVVDEDVDVFDEREVVWAILTRLNWKRGVDLIKNMPRGDKVVIDATKPLDIPFPEKNKIPDIGARGDEIIAALMRALK